MTTRYHVNICTPSLIPEPLEAIRFAALDCWQDQWVSREQIADWVRHGCPDSKGNPSYTEGAVVPTEADAAKLSGELIERRIFTTRPDS